MYTKKVMKGPNKLYHKFCLNVKLRSVAAYSLAPTSIYFANKLPMEKKLTNFSAYSTVWNVTNSVCKA